MRFVIFLFLLLTASSFSFADDTVPGVAKNLNGSKATQRAGGTTPTDCLNGKVEEGGLCYDPPREGYRCTALICSESCRDGYSISGAQACHFNGATSYAVPANGKGGSTTHKCQSAYYENCRNGYATSEGSCGICSFKGAWDYALQTYARPAGKVPGGCPSGKHMEAGLCYGEALGQ